MRKETIEVLHTYSHAVASAMNVAKVRPAVDPDSEGVCAVMIVVALRADERPLGCSLNWDQKGGFWKVDPQADMAEPYDGH